MAIEDALNPPDPAAFLAAAGWPAPVAVTRITGGWDTLMWRVVTPAGAAHALRIYRPGPGRDTAAAQREAAALRAAAEAGLPAPAVEMVGEHEGVSFMLQNWLPGRPLVERVERTPWRLWTLGEQFGRLHARLHAVPPPDAIRPRTPTSWTRRIRDERLAEAVRDRAVSDTFCHFDFHPLNVLAERGRITALLDFVNATVADRRADLGVTQSQLLVAPLPPDARNPVMQLARRGFAAAWRRGYARRAGGFPLTPLFEAWGAAYYLVGLEDAVRDRRGWATPTDVATVKRYIAERSRAAGITTTTASHLNQSLVPL
jgi:aminoglycoside phosphotransferase (APT) family kinase protein